MACGATIVVATGEMRIISIRKATNHEARHNFSQITY
jgi:uncharacterized DUF497 family protein